jgi:hypothetical protein
LRHSPGHAPPRRGLIGLRGAAPCHHRAADRINAATRRVTASPMRSGATTAPGPCGSVRSGSAPVHRCLHRTVFAPDCLHRTLCRIAPYLDQGGGPSRTGLRPSGPIRRAGLAFSTGSSLPVAATGQSATAFSGPCRDDRVTSAHRLCGLGPSRPCLLPDGRVDGGTR